MKKKLFFLSVLILGCVANICAMQSDSSDKKDSIDPMEAMQQEVSDNLEKESVLKSLLQSKYGRDWLLNVRVGTISADTSVSDKLPGNNIFLSSSLAYGGNTMSSLFMQFTSHRSIYEKYKYRMFASNLAEMEEAFLQDQTQSSNLQNLEHTRIHDIYLLKAIIEQDYNPVIKEGCAGLLALLEHTHKKWPPQHHPSLHKVSAFTAIKEALKNRRDNNVDKLDEEGDSESGTITSNRKK